MNLFGIMTMNFQFKQSDDIISKYIKRDIRIVLV